MDINTITQQEIYQALIDWFWQHSLSVLLILVISFVISKFANLLISKAIRQAVKRQEGISHEAEMKREDTLIGIFTQVVKIGVWLIAVMMILSEFGIDTAPLIAGAGILGVAFGFGGQYLIKDLITGFFIILENQYRKGDVVCLGDQCGLVESINLRTTILRDLDGVVHHVPNGEIKVASNMSMDYARVNIDVGVSYGSDLAKVEEVVNKVGQELAEDEEWGQYIITPPKFLRVDGFADSAIMIKILGDTQPIKQWSVAGELRKRLKNAFDENGIEIPFPQRVMYQAPAPSSKLSKKAAGNKPARKKSSQK